ncbi:DNA/RNA helicase domain-containing protein [Pseudoclavibacter sp. 8L]|uniref:DNA/RNA helicase domain-containing protein n=1 Tax=Pseudoclavibacter sp. 8L TaxID=2653162 RepID=UPI0012F05743|nr:DNA/RNA helicase domain-containing protein [Pseudoclavibacter sp. 8L]VXB99774.1 AAA family ATPase [Pseudoclavibacter sp. 8L]
MVYVLDGPRGARRGSVYVGQTISAESRLTQHLASQTKAGLRSARVILDDTFNKSVCLDLESHLIRWFAGDGEYTVLNGNEGVADSAYYSREDYRESFEEIFEQLRADGLFEQTIPEIENSDLFKLSPFKALSRDQTIAADQILKGLFEDLELKGEERSMSVVEGSPGTGKTIVAIYLLKLLAEIRDWDENEPRESNTLFADFFVRENKDLLEGKRMGLVVPQQSLRRSIRNVFKKTPNLHPGMVLSPFDLGKVEEPFDILFVDETHRLNQRANQASGVLNKKFAEINKGIFGADSPQYTQLDWVRKRSRHSICMLDVNQTVRPADLPREVMLGLLDEVRRDERHYPLMTQMRVKAGTDYIGFVQRLLRGERGLMLPDLGEYDLRFFDDVGEMRAAIRERDAEVGLSRMVAGYAWDWVSKGKTDVYDIELDGERMRWNSTDKDWINSPNALEEVGSIHTVQGYDLNYAGVIIGPDLRGDPMTGEIRADKAAYRDKKGKEANKVLGKTYGDAELLEYIRNIYSVLMTRGMRGTYIYVTDPGVCEFFSRIFCTMRGAREASN